MNKGVGIPRKKQAGTHRICLLSLWGQRAKTEMEMEDGTVYHVSTFYGGSTEIGSLPDALTLETPFSYFQIASLENTVGIW